MTYTSIFYFSFIYLLFTTDYLLLFIIFISLQKIRYNLILFLFIGFYL